MYYLLRKILFCLPTELTHHLCLSAISIAERLKLSSSIAAHPKSLPMNIMGLEFPNPVGLAAGLDKNAEHILGLSALGFGFIEVGTVTPKPQPGNPKPRLFRLPKAQAIINRMGFNNHGVDYLVEQVAKSGYKGILGINIGKNKLTPTEKAVNDYVICMRKVYPYASYITVNLSSPNTPGLRDLQFGEPLDTLLAELKRQRSALHKEYGYYVPLAVKIAPDMMEEDITHVAAALIKHNIDGVIATNTTITRDSVKHLSNAEQTGGLSGAPLKDQSTQVIHSLAKALNGKLPIIGVGGIINAEDGVEKIKAGAQLIQIYSGFIYSGPALIEQCVNAIAKISKQE